jgi:hypothetical protein
MRVWCNGSHAGLRNQSRKGCGFDSLHAHHLRRYRLAARTIDSQSINRGSIPRTGTIYALIEYRLVRRSFKAESRVRFPVGAPICGCDGTVDMNVSKTLFCGSDSHLPHQFTVSWCNGSTGSLCLLRSRSEPCEGSTPSETTILGLILRSFP